MSFLVTCCNLTLKQHHGVTRTEANRVCVEPKHKEKMDITPRVLTKTEVKGKTILHTAPE